MNTKLLKLVGIVFVLVASTVAVAAAPQANYDSGDFLFWNDFEDNTQQNFAGSNGVVADSFNDQYSLEFGTGTTDTWVSGEQYAMNWSEGKQRFYMRYKPNVGGGQDVITTLSGTEGTGNNRAIEIETSPFNTDPLEINLARDAGDNQYRVATCSDCYYGTTWSEMYVEIFPNETMKLWSWQAGETPPESPQIQVDTSYAGINEAYLYYQDDSTGDGRFRIDQVGFNEGIPVTGSVTNRQGDPINNATVTIESNGQSTSTVTGENGGYALAVAEGQYNITAEKEGYSAETKSQFIDSPTTVNFELIEKSEVFDFRVGSYMDHGTTQPYEAYFHSGGLYREKVTNDISVTSDNTSVITVNETSNNLVATDDESVAQRVNITAQYVADNETYNSTQIVVVANRTIDNIEIMPSDQWIPTALGFGEEGTVFGLGSEIQWVFVAIFTGGAAAWFARNEWLGIGVILSMNLLFWTLGNTSLGITLVAVFYGLFAGYQLNKIPSRSDTNVQPSVPDQPDQPNQ